MVERLHRKLKTGLRCHRDPTPWIDRLPLVLLGVRTALKAGFEVYTRGNDLWNYSQTLWTVFRTTAKL